MPKADTNGPARILASLFLSISLLWIFHFIMPDFDFVWIMLIVFTAIAFNLRMSKKAQQKYRLEVEKHKRAYAAWEIRWICLRCGHSFESAKTATPSTGG